VNARTEYLQGIRSIERIARVHGLKRFLENAGLVFLSLFTVSRGMHWFGWHMVGGAAFFCPAAGISVICAGVRAWFTKKPFYRRLIDIDAAFDLQDRLSTAYEYLQRNRQTEFLDLLIRDAGEKISQLDKKQIFPKRTPWVPVLLSVLIALNLLMAVVKYPFIAEAPDAVDPDTMKRIRQVITQYSTAPIEKAPRPKKIVSDRIRETITRLSNLFANSSLPQKDVRTSVHSALQEIQGEQIARARDLVEELGLDSTESVSVQHLQQIDHLTHFQLKKLYEMVDKMFDHQIPEAVSEDLAVLDEYHRLEAYLDQIQDGLEKGTTRQSAPEKDPWKDFEEPVSGKETVSKNRSGAQNPAPASQSSTSDQRTPSAEAGQTRSAQNRSPEEAEGDELGNGPSSAGLGKSVNSSGASHEPGQLKGSAVQDRIASAQESRVSVLIRSLTAAGSAKMEPERIERDYQQAIESILQKEEIPLPYRTYIRNYFLSIGLRKESSSSGRNQ